MDELMSRVRSVGGLGAGEAKHGAIDGEELDREPEREKRRDERKNRWCWEKMEAEKRFDVGKTAWRGRGERGRRRGRRVWESAERRNGESDCSGCSEPRALAWQHFLSTGRTSVGRVNNESWMSSGGGGREGEKREKKKLREGRVPGMSRAYVFFSLVFCLFFFLIVSLVSLVFLSLTPTVNLTPSFLLVARCKGHGDERASGEVRGHQYPKIQ
jgi:hypothetical protein